MSEIRFNRWSHQSGTGGIYQDSSGNIGIGTSTPTSILDIQGGSIKIGNDLLTSSGVSTFTSGLNVTGGSVGINETNPDRLLHVTVGSDTALVKFENSASSGRTQVQYVNPHGDWVHGIEGGSTSGDFLTYTGDSKNIKFYTSGIVRQKIQGDGKVIVGGNANQTSNRNLSVVAESGNSNNTEIGLQPTNSSGGYNPEVIIGTTADGTYGAHMFFTTRDTSGNRPERLRITSSGNVGIGLTNPGDKLSVYNSNNGNPTGITIRNTEASSQYSHARLRLESQNAAAYGEIWADVANAGLRLGYNSSNTVKINSSGNIVFNSGSGIDFSATSDGSGTASSEILDDYEEGTWTPTIRSYPNTITRSGGTAEHFTYTKIGNQVTVYFVLDGVTTSGTTGGVMRIDGLPYAPAVGTNWRTIGPPLFFYGSGLRAADFPVFPHLNQSSATVQFYYKGSATSNYMETTVANVGTGSYVFFQVTYQVN